MRLCRKIKKNIALYLFLFPTLLYYLIFHYWPMYGIQIAFKDFIPVSGIWGSPWVGFEHFERFFKSFHFWEIISNTIGISLYELVLGFPLPIILALLLNQMEVKWFKKLVQTVTYAPHFISTVVLVSMLLAFLSPRTGLVNVFIKSMGMEPIQFMGEPGWFKTLYVLSNIWQHTGWGSIIYLAALSGISPDLHEAAVVDGASKIQRIWHIDIPGILPTAVILLILRFGSIMGVGFEKVFLMQNPLNLSSSNIISTYVYQSGLIGGQFSFASAVGFFNSVINFILLILVNRIAKKLGETSLW